MLLDKKKQVNIHTTVIYSTIHIYACFAKSETFQFHEYKLSSSVVLTDFYYCPRRKLSF